MHAITAYHLKSDKADRFGLSSDSSEYSNDAIKLSLGSRQHGGRALFTVIFRAHSASFSDRQESLACANVMLTSTVVAFPLSYRGFYGEMYKDVSRLGHIIASSWPCEFDRVRHRRWYPAHPSSLRFLSPRACCAHCVRSPAAH
jgi:hypothetical protein